MPQSGSGSRWSAEEEQRLATRVRRRPDRGRARARPQPQPRGDRGAAGQARQDGRFGRHHAAALPAEARRQAASAGRRAVRQPSNSAAVTRSALCRPPSRAREQRCADQQQQHADDAQQAGARDAALDAVAEPQAGEANGTSIAKPTRRSASMSPPAVNTSARMETEKITMLDSVARKRPCPSCGAPGRSRRAARRCRTASRSRRPRSPTTGAQARLTIRVASPCRSA